MKRRMDRDRTRPGRPRLTIGRLMTLVAIAAVDCALLAAMMRDAESNPLTWSLAVIAVAGFDLLVSLTLLSFRKMVRPAPGGRRSALLLVLAILVLGTCAGRPVGTMVLILLHLW
jgi:hypothetical protein